MKKIAFKLLILCLFSFSIAYSLELEITKGRFSQTVDYEYIAIEKNKFYYKGTITNEHANSKKQSVKSSKIIGQNYRVKLRSGYYHPYFSVMLDYIFFNNYVNFYDDLDILKEDLSKNRQYHQLVPYFFLAYQPLRIGISYNWLMGNRLPLENEQLWTLKLPESLALYSQIYFTKIFNTPLGFSSFYEFAFQIGEKAPNIGKNHYQDIGMALHLDFNYYIQLKFMFSNKRSRRNFKISKILFDKSKNEEEIKDLTENDNDLIDLTQEIIKEDISRYYFDISFIFNIIESVSLSLTMGKMTYSEWESPMTRFKISINYYPFLP